MTRADATQRLYTAEEWDQVPNCIENGYLVGVCCPDREEDFICLEECEGELIEPEIKEIDKD